MVLRARRQHNSEVQLSSTLATASASFSSSVNKNCIEYYYLTEDAKKNLKTYSYRGCDKSLLYQYILSPLASLLVNKIVPKSVAPNTITIVGLLWMITAYVVYWWYVPSLEFTKNDISDGIEDNELSFIPRWIYLWNGISILVYQTLDNMDGKQAQRTGSSSPLGLLFDHGCDAINSIFGSANIIIGMNLNPSENMLQTWVLVFAPFLVFYMATWEQFVTGELILPIINGASEGLLGTAFLSFVSYWFGSQYWQQTDIFDSISSIDAFNEVTESAQVRNCDLIVIAISVLAFQEVILKSIAVSRKYKDSTLGLIPMLVLALCYLVVGYIDSNVWLAIPRTSLHLSMALFAEMTTELMLAHMTGKQFSPWRWQVAPLIGITFWVAMFGNSEGLRYAIIIYAWVMGSYLIMKCFCIIDEIREVMEIWCFDIVTPYNS